MKLLLGVHVSVAGGVSRAIARGTDLGCEAIQVFVKNASQWVGKPLSDEEVERFHHEHAASSIGPVVAHSTYLINLAATDANNLSRSRAALGDELDRCHRLGIAGLVVHPGAHLGAGEEAGIERIAESILEVLAERPEGTTRVLLENTAGQGTLVGYRLQHLAAIMDLADRDPRIGICLDTCHAFGAGYAIHEEAGLSELASEVDELFGSSEPSCLHLNDSRHELGSRRDRHANLGEGHIGLDLFERLLHDPHWQGAPAILETPLGDDGEGHRRDLELLRSLRGD
jgi:deoxyribonuclease-4